MRGFFELSSASTFGVAFGFSSVALGAAFVDLSALLDLAAGFVGLAGDAVLGLAFLVLDGVDLLAFFGAGAAGVSLTAGLATFSVDFLAAGFTGFLVAFVGAGSVTFLGAFFAGLSLAAFALGADLVACFLDAFLTLAGLLSAFFALFLAAGFLDEDLDGAMGRCWDCGRSRYNSPNIGALAKNRRRAD